MAEYKVVLTWEAIYDITDISDYIEAEFNLERADKFQKDIQKRIGSLGQLSGAFPKTQVLYRNYAIQKNVFSPSLIFYVVKEAEKEIHVLRVLREERDWKNILKSKQNYTYPE